MKWFFHQLSPTDPGVGVPPWNTYMTSTRPAHKKSDPGVAILSIWIVLSRFVVGSRSRPRVEVTFLAKGGP
jgi:hypothetical protein